jgi:diguanylate cyclase (GGDEF)-like protein
MRPPSPQSAGAPRPPRFHARLAPALAIAAAVIVIAGTAIFTSSRARSVSNRGSQAVATAQSLLTAMLDRETGLRGFLLTDDRSFLAPYVTGKEEFNRAAERARAYADAEPQARSELDRQVAIAREWQLQSERAIAGVDRRGVRPIDLREALERKSLMDEFRAINSSYEQTLNIWREGRLSHLTLISTIVIVAMALMQALSGLLVVRLTEQRERRQREALDAAESVRAGAERAYVESLRQFGELVQASETETETRELIRRRIEIGLPGSSVVVLNRNNSASRLEAVTAPADPDVSAALIGAQPRACLAVRMGRTHRGGGESNAMISCEICGNGVERTVCEPLLVGGEVIGSLLITHPEELDDQAQRLITDTVAYASPVLANLRNLAIAERRAHTDALTGLPNRRALDDTFKRLLAQATRASAPLSIVLLDLDHFKQVNDAHGHDRGDEVLAGVATTLADSLREMDFAARMGGEEFLVLLPDTDLAGAMTATEGIARAIAKTFLPGTDIAITASFGIAGYPEHGLDPVSLTRSADRALYQAKQDGRNCIRVASAAADGERAEHHDSGELLNA